MALVVEDFMVLNVRFQDRDKNVSTVGFRFAALLDLTLFVAAVPTVLIPALQAISDAEIAGWSLVQSAEDATIGTTTIPSETSDVERKGQWTLKTDNGHPVIVQVPSIRNTLVVDGTQVINRAAASIIDFEEILDGTTLLDTSELVSNRGEEIAGVVKAVKVHKNSRKG